MSIKLFDVKWKINTAGPSPYDNERTEVFLFGCERAVKGNPCKGCFNPKLWDSSVAIYTHEPKDIANKIARYAPNRYVTIGGGEPTDQMEELIELCIELKAKGFHIMVYTWKNVRELFDINNVGNDKSISDRKNFSKLFKVIDMIVDGEYHDDERMYQDNGTDGTFNSIGSGNQVVWDTKSFAEDIKKLPYAFLSGYQLKDILQMAIHEKTKDLIYLVKDNSEQLSLFLQ